MRTLLTGLAVAAALVLMVVSAGLNYQFMASLARTADEARVMGSAAVAGDVLKACLPFFVFLAWRERRYVFVVVGLPIFLLLSVMSLVAALGNAAEMRGGTAQLRDTRSEVLRDAEAALQRLNAIVEGGVPHRAPAEIEAQLSILRQDKRWTSSHECREATVQSSRGFCADYFGVVAAHAASLAAERNLAEQAALKARVEALRREGAGGEAEPQVQILAGLSGQDRGFVRTALIVLSAVFIELGSGLGLYLALHHSPRRRLPDSGARDKSRPSERAYLNEAVYGGDSVERYAVARLVPARGRATTPSQLYADYVGWCRTTATDVLPPQVFQSRFSELAADLGIARSGPAYRDVAIEPVASLPSASPAALVAPG